MECNFEELVVALADCLWRGKRNNELEHRVIAQVAEILDRDDWDVFVSLENGFEKISAGGDLRLLRSKGIAI